MYLSRAELDPTRRETMVALISPPEISWCGGKRFLPVRAAAGCGGWISWEKNCTCSCSVRNGRT